MLRNCAVQSSTGDTCASRSLASVGVHDSDISERHAESELRSRACIFAESDERSVAATKYRHLIVPQLISTSRTMLVTNYNVDTYAGTSKSKARVRNVPYHSQEPM